MVTNVLTSWQKALHLAEREASARRLLNAESIPPAEIGQQLLDRYNVYRRQVEDDEQAMIFMEKAREQVRLVAQVEKLIAQTSIGQLKDALEQLMGVSGGYLPAGQVNPRPFQKRDLNDLWHRFVTNVLSGVEIPKAFESLWEIISELNAELRNVLVQLKI